ncbi:MAG: hypothetical protein HYT73_02085 [Candidatus Aenigmarchaeota archaeon]|nr:hypothetical protein [Candidatus Aenigmarchaeota archaeon]
MAFIGQVTTKIEGCAEQGEYIVPSGKNDGKGKAVAKSLDNLIDAVGTAWESGCGYVKVAVGIK